MQVLLLPFANWDGSTHMAADEMMLEAAIAGLASFRFYTWSQPTVSLGYFQSANDRKTHEGLEDLPFVRRATGGGTLVHHHELTYALALPSGGHWQPRGTSWICRMHELIGRSLRTWGISAERVGCGEERKLGSVLCFQHQTVGDLLLAHQKIAGSAQRKSRGAVLQHGGILLSCSRHAPQLNGIVELSGVSISADSLRQALEGQLEGAFGWTLNRENWSACDLEQIRTIESAKYANAAWNLKR